MDGRRGTEAATVPRDGDATPVRVSRNLAVKRRTDAPTVSNGLFADRDRSLMRAANDGTRKEEGNEQMFASLLLK